MQTTINTTNVIRAFWDKSLLVSAAPNLIYPMFGVDSNLPNNEGDQVMWVKVNSLATKTTPLTQGQDPAASSYSTTTIKATPDIYGDYIPISTFKLNTMSDVVLTGVNQAQGIQSGSTLNEVCCEVLNSGTQVVFANGVAARGNVVKYISGGDIATAVASLANGNAPKITEWVKTDGASKTEPLPPCYVGICHPNSVPDIQAIPGFIPVEKYAQNTALLPDEIGKVAGVRIHQTTTGKRWLSSGGAVAGTGMRSSDGVSCDVYSLLIKARNAFGRVKFRTGKAGSSQGATIEYIVKSPETAGSALNMYGTSGWKAYAKYVRLNEDYLCRIEHAVSVRREPSLQYVQIV